VDRDGVPVLIDVEQMLYFDVEWEHAFMRNILGDDYPQMAVPTWTRTASRSTPSPSTSR
jgi:hypothetical protein